MEEILWLKRRIFLGAVIGGTAAAVAALLLAPKSGKELRDDLSNQTDDLKTKRKITQIMLFKRNRINRNRKTKAGVLSDQASDLAGSVKEKQKIHWIKHKVFLATCLITLKTNR